MIAAEAATLAPEDIRVESVAPRVEPIQAPEVRTIPKIVDPSVAEEEDMEPLFPDTSRYVEDRRQRSGGWLSLFGRPRSEAPAPTPALRATSSAQPAPMLAPEEPAAEGDDLDIPSFLRRLAN